MNYTAYEYCQLLDSIKSVMNKDNDLKTIARILMKASPDLRDYLFKTYGSEWVTQLTKDLTLKQEE